MSETPTRAQERREAYAEKLALRVAYLIGLVPQDLLREERFWETLGTLQRPWEAAERGYLGGEVSRDDLNAAAGTLMVNLRAEVEARGCTLPDEFPRPETAPGLKPIGPEPEWLRDGAWNGLDAGTPSIFSAPPPTLPEPPSWDDVPPPQEPDGWPDEASAQEWQGYEAEY